MPTIPVNAYAFSSTFKLKELVPLFMRPGAPEPRIKERLIAAIGEGGYALAYDFGAVVFVGVEADEQAGIIQSLIKQLPPEPHPPLTENFLIEVGGKAVGVRFDRVIVTELSLDQVDIVALVLAQSVAMDYYARDVDSIEEETDRIASTLRKLGRIPGRMSNLIQFIGLCIATRNDIISTLALFDKPDVTWEDESLDKLWIELYRMLELDDRYKVLEAKLRMFQDNLMVLVDLSRARSSLRLELVVVVLILLEIVIMIWQIVKG